MLVLKAQIAHMHMYIPQTMNWSETSTTLLLKPSFFALKKYWNHFFWQNRKRGSELSISIIYQIKACEIYEITYYSFNFFAESFLVCQED